MTTAPTRIPEAEITGLYGGLLKLGLRRMFGQVPDSVRVSWQNPRVLKDLMSFGRRAEKWDLVDPGLAALATMAAASRVGCEFCLDLHYFLAHDRGLDEAKAREVPRWRGSAAFTPLERAVMAYAEAMCETPLAVADEMSAELLEALGAPALVELTARVGAMNLTARTNIALGIRSEHFAEACGMPPMADSSDRRSSSA